MLQVEVIGIQIIFKVMQLGGITKGASKSKERKKKDQRLSSWALKYWEVRRLEETNKRKLTSSTNRRKNKKVDDLEAKWRKYVKKWLTVLIVTDGSKKMRPENWLMGLAIRKMSVNLSRAILIW